MNRVIYAIDQLSKTVGHAFAWCIIILTLGTTYEVFVRYVMNDPTSWAFDFSYIMYGALFFMAGAYTLSRGGHVRADMFYRLWRPRTQATVELLLYIVFFFPGVLATHVIDGRTMAIPWYVDTRVLFYRQDLLRAAGLPDAPQQVGDGSPIRWPLLTRGNLDQGPDAARD